MTNAERRIKFRQGLSTLYQPVYDALCAALPEEWAPFQGLRTVAAQDLLFAQGRVSPGPKVTNAKGGQSPHNYGCATDWTIFVGGQPVWLPRKDPQWAVYVAACIKAGARWGGDWNGNGVEDKSDFDRPHNELSIECAWAQVNLVLIKNGMRSAQEYIEERMTRR